MNLQELIAAYRAQSKDSCEPFLADDGLLTIYANEAQVEACRRGQLLVGTVFVEAKAGAEDVALPANAIRVIRATVGGRPLEGITADGMDAIFCGWQDHGNRAQPRYLVSGINTGKLNLWPRPDVDCTIRLTLQLLPSKRLASLTNDSPEIRSEMHPALVEWMLYKVYSQTDSDLFDPSKAAFALANFEAEFGRKSSGRNETWVRQGDGLMPGPIA